MSYSQPGQDGIMGNQRIKMGITTQVGTGDRGCDLRGLLPMLRCLGHQYLCSAEQTGWAVALESKFGKADKNIRAHSTFSFYNDQN